MLIVLSFAALATSILVIISNWSMLMVSCDRASTRANQYMEMHLGLVSNDGGLRIDWLSGTVNCATPAGAGGELADHDSVYPHALNFVREKTDEATRFRSYFISSTDSHPLGFQYRWSSAHNAKRQISQLNLSIPYWFPFACFTIPLLIVARRAFRDPKTSNRGFDLVRLSETDKCQD
ncbi:MAG TPA: hypothetical protein VH370_05990, partial [Humisphaera sp.]|nr:hypothetical protein [Humisphaera sp.]